MEEKERTPRLQKPTKERVKLFKLTVVS